MNKGIMEQNSQLKIKVIITNSVKPDMSIDLIISEESFK